MTFVAAVLDGDQAVIAADTGVAQFVDGHYQLVGTIEKIWPLWSGFACTTAILELASELHAALVACDANDMTAIDRAVRDLRPAAEELLARMDPRVRLREPRGGHFLTIDRQGPRVRGRVLNWQTGSLTDLPPPQRLVCVPDGIDESQIADLFPAYLEAIERAPDCSAVFRAIARLFGEIMRRYPDCSNCSRELQYGVLTIGNDPWTTEADHYLKWQEQS